jgi:hypothetical protein
MKRTLSTGWMVGVLAAFAACSGSIRSGQGSAADSIDDPLAMPQDLIDFENARDWGTHHLEWHTERQWDLMDKSDLAWAKQQGWKRADIQEGAKGNGFDFLVMHRAMIGILTQQFPKDAGLFAGWTSPPTDPSDPNNPGASGAFDSSMLQAIDTLTNHLDKFASEDDFGLYLETNLRPVKGNPQASSSDPTTGIHNYLHNRFSNSNSPIDLGDPSKNLANQLFWRLHGWIDARWTAYRQLKNLSDSDPAYQAALQNATNMFTAMKMGGPLGGGGEPPAPDTLTKFFENENNWGDNGGGQAIPAPSGGGTPDPCTGVADGSYCGGDGVAGDGSTLFVCAGGVTSSTQACASGCQAGSPASDACATAPQDPCTGVADGSYCGGDGVAGDPSTLYTCQGGGTASQNACSSGCSANGGGSDACN